MKSQEAPAVNETLLDEKLASLEKSKNWSPRAISRLENLIRSGDDFSLFRVNPITYAGEKGLPEKEAIDLFLHATIAGLFEMNWNLVCPGCTAVVESFATLKNFHSHFHCATCNADIEASLDDYIMISFTVAPEIREISFHHPELLGGDEYLSKYHFSKEGMIKGGYNWVEQISKKIPYFTYMEPGERKAFSAKVDEGVLVIADLLNHTGTPFMVSGEKGNGGAARIRLAPSSVEGAGSAIHSGEASFDVVHEGSRKGLLTLINLPLDYKERYPVEFLPYLSGKKLLNTQSFRDLFRHEVIQGMESLGVKDISIIFTDLKGSTSLYERIGDLKAFSLVREHFDILARVITANSGAIVKTIGDAVMGTFMNPYDAVKAAIEMRRAIQAMNSSTGKRDLILKIGIHKGASIVVNLNDRLDYFGQTVNVASRVQQLAEADEILITDEMYGYDGVKELLSDFGVAQSRARLRGVMDEVSVFRINA